MSASQALQIESSIEIRVPPEKVFDAWTDPKQLLAWWGDDTMYHSTSWECDVRNGGRWRCEGLMASGDSYSVTGEYLVVNRPNCLSFTWAPNWDAPVITTVVVEFIAIPSGTLLTLKHTGFKSVQSRDGHTKGWERVLAWAKAYVESASTN
jgi:uncharacterized protein YndB with AHSA1/START domain